MAAAALRVVQVAEHDHWARATETSPDSCAVVVIVGRVNPQFKSRRTAPQVGGDGFPGVRRPHGTWSPSPLASVSP